jgi:hypothetical protein
MSVEKEQPEPDLSSYVQKAGATAWANFLAVLIALVCLQWWSTARALQHPSSWTDAFITWAEQGGSAFIVTGYVLVLAGFTVLMLFVIDRTFHIFRLSKSHSFYWLRVTFLIFVFSEIEWIGSVYINATFLSAFNLRHPIYFQAVIRANCVAVFLIAGSGLYLLKQRTKLVYGVSEIAISVASNLALLHKIDLSQAPKISIATADAVAFGVFTYLLSRGIGNVVEGIDEVGAKKASEAAGPYDGG